MALVIAALTANGASAVEHIAESAESYPAFTRDLIHLGGRVTPMQQPG
jgi:UDP-N-acetylglucosamine enolpyruvyl transferase